MPSFWLQRAELNPDEFGNLLNRLGMQHQTMGRFTLPAMRSPRRWPRMRSRSNPAIPPSPAVSRIWQWCCRIWGSWRKRASCCGKALASDEQSFEPGHPSIAISQSNLALVLKDLGQLEEARELLRKALASDEKSFEPGHPSIALSQSNLAMVLKDLGQLEEARELLRKALASDEQSFEPGHPSIAISQSNLAMVLQGSGAVGGSARAAAQGAGLG